VITVTTPAVSDFVWIDGDPCADATAVLRAGERPGEHWTGQYALHVQDGGRHTPRPPAFALFASPPVAS